MATTELEHRLSGVWGADKHQELSLQRGSPVVLMSRQSEGTTCAKRHEAASWMEKLTGLRVPAEEGLDFIFALADGVLLSKVVNAMCPDAIKDIQVVEGLPAAAFSQRRHQNVQNVINAVKQLKVPAEFTFRHEDLNSDCDQQQCSRVVDCVLWLKRLYEGHNEMPSAVHVNDLATDMDVDRKTTQSARTASTFSKASLQQPMQKAAVPLHNISSSESLMPAASTGVAQLLTQWTTILKASMQETEKVNSQTAVPSTVLMDRVFNEAIGNLTADFERKVSAKEREVVRSRDALQAMQVKMHGMEEQLSQMKLQIETQRQEIEQAATAEMEEAMLQLKRDLQEREQVCSQLQWQLDNTGQAGQHQVAALQQDVDNLSARLKQFENLESKYKRTCDENRKLYNLVQDLRGSIRVFCRIRPLGRTGDSSSSCMEVGEEGELAVHDPSGQSDCRLFRFDKVFNESTNQSEVYEDTEPLIRSVLDGYNVCIFAYGQTGSGKTHTMSGTNIENPEGRGINYRALQGLFAMIEERKEEMEYSIKVQMLEIYNETLLDLLSKDQKSSVKLELLNTMPSGCNVKNAEQVDVAGPEAVLGLMARGSRNRRVAETNMNERSSRSHQVLTVVVDSVNKVSGATTHSCLNLVDLAGSERVKSSKAAGDRLVETCNINSSLSALGDVVAALARKDAHVPFRNSKLTQLLADSLSGQAKVMMFMHISPEGSFMSETLSTLQFGTKVSSVTLGQAKRNVDNSKLFANEEISRSRKEVREKEEALHSMQRKWQDERKQREQLQKEVERLKAQLDSAARRGHESTPSRSQEAFATPSARLPRNLQVTPLEIPQPRSFSTPVSTPTPNGATPTSSRRATVYKAKIPEPPLQAPRHAEPSPPVTKVSASARTVGVYGMARASSFGAAPAPASSRFSAASASSGLPTAPVPSRPNAVKAAPTIPAAAPVASAGGRRASIGQWKQ